MWEGEPAEGPLARLNPELLERSLDFTGGTEQLARLSCISRAFRSAATEAARAKALAALGGGFDLKPGGTWFQALYLAELRSGWGRRTVLLGRYRTVLAAKTHGLFVRKGALYDLPYKLFDDERWLTDHHILHLSAWHRVAAVTRSGKLLMLGNAGAVYHLPGLAEMGGALSGLHVVSAEVSHTHAVVLTADGWIFTFGDGIFGPLGHGTHDAESRPRRVLGVLTLRRVVQVEVGDLCTLAVTADGELFTFGMGRDGRLGHGTETDELTPRRVEGALSAERVVAVATGRTHTVVLTATGSVFTFGSGAFGQLGHGNLHDQHTPLRVEALLDHRVVRVAAGEGHTAVLTATGVVLTFGRNSYRQLGRVPDQWRSSLPGEVELAAVVDECVVELVLCGQCTGLVTWSGRLLTFGCGEGAGCTACELPK
jgi:hypothetical protein